MRSNSDSRDELNGRIQRAILRTLVGMIVVAAGFAIGYVRYGDAVDLRERVVAQQKRIADLESDRETMSTKMVKKEWLASEYEGCLRALADCERAGQASKP